MISYFKFTDGSDFTLNGSPYTGLINVIDSNVYTGSIFDSNSKQLSSTGTFLSKCFEKGINFNFTARSTLKNEIQKVSVYPRTILTVDTLQDTLAALSENNLKIFASSVRYDNKFLNPLYRSPNDQSFTNCITSVSDTNVRPIRFPLNKIPIAFSQQSNIAGFTETFTSTLKKSSILLTDGLSGFKYFNNGGSVTGLCNSVSAVQFGSGYPNNIDFTHNYLHYNRHTDLVYQTNNFSFSVFNIDYTSPIPRTLLQDTIDISSTNSIISFYNVAYGRNFRSALVETGSDIVIEFYRVDNAKLITTLSRLDLNLKTITNICQRFEDDLLIVVGTDFTDVQVFATFDIEEIINGNTTPITYTSDISPIFATFAECADFDSDIVIFKRYNSVGYLDSVEYRSITAPTSILAQYNSEFDINVRVNDIVSTASVDLSADNRVLGTFYSNYNSYFIDIVHRTDNKVNTAIVTDTSFTVDTKTVYTYLLPKNLKQSYTHDLNLIRNSSIGLTINGVLHKIITDTLSLYYNYRQKFLFGSDGSPLYTVATFLQSFNVDNLLLYSNESINIGTLNRVINAITDIQTAIVNELG